MEDRDTRIRLVAAQKDAWAALSAKEKLALIDELMDRLKEFSDELHEASIEKRDEPGAVLKDQDNNTGKAGDGNDAAEEAEGGYACLDPEKQRMLETASGVAHWLHSSMLIGIWLSVIREYFEAVVLTGKPPRPLAVTPVQRGTKKEEEDTQKPSQHLVKVGPKGLLFTTMLSFGTMELLVDGAVEQDMLHERPGGVVAVLGAGNFDAPVDVLAALFIENSVCVYKSSPFNHRVGPVLERIFKPLVDRNFLLFVEGDVKEATALLHHECVTKWIMTGSIHTASRIIWGSPNPPPRADPLPKPVFDKPFIGELGSCTPWIICPGKWSKRELDWHARNVAAALLYNGAHICVHPQLLLTCKNWAQRDAFLNLVREYQRETLYVGCYYPDYADRIRGAREKLLALGQKPEDFEVPVSVPLSGRFAHKEMNYVIFATDLPQDNFIAVEEMFSPVCGEVPLDTPATVADFLPAAVEYANEKVWGTLSVSVSVKPNSHKDEQAVESAILDLRYGSVHINALSMFAIAFPTLVWGGYPGASIFDLQSGLGFYGNCYGFKRPIKSVIRAPFLNFTQMLIVPSNKHNVRKMAKLWRRIVVSILDRRSTQGWFSFSGQITKIVSAFVANL
ncbi:aldehyde dehydrogenase [Besnoitia besnoiti]|uniref:Aldehyde dehydrogenase n=1 Tax=Besnoitia besnoiti TaxID=94643 RepID=A0A2A9MKE8_BESBE|nr:aldehyde dehydrogenase [Besnoitia besnoiti]PFH37684.1 aldehyde dehydrogenase [Besnoitia besnoiti]